MRDALAFLTVLPVGRRTGPPGRAAIAAFPLVGLFVGLLWWASGRAGVRLWSPLVGAALALAADLLVTGGLHLDGLADEADGIACHLPPSEAAAVMREGPVGAIGASTAAIVLLLRFALLSVAFAGSLGHRAAAVIAVPVAGRFCMVWTMARTRDRPQPAGSAGREQGAPMRRDQLGPHAVSVGEDSRQTPAGSLASEIRQAARGLPLLCSGGVALVSCYVLAGPRGVVGLASACLVSSLNAGFAARRLDGVAGDVIGAGGLLAETAMLAAIVGRL